LPHSATHSRFRRQNQLDRATWNLRISLNLFSHLANLTLKVLTLFDAFN
jgi:hypothetical protein